MAGRGLAHVNYWRLALVSASHVARCLACRSGCLLSSNYQGIPPAISGFYRVAVPLASDPNRGHGGFFVHSVAHGPGRYVYLKYGVARRNGDVIPERRKEERRRIRPKVANAERRYGDRRHRDITSELQAFGWAVVHR